MSGGLREYEEAAKILDEARRWLYAVLAGDQVRAPGCARAVKSRRARDPVTGDPVTGVSGTGDPWVTGDQVLGDPGLAPGTGPRRLRRPLIGRRSARTQALFQGIHDLRPGDEVPERGQVLDLVQAEALE